ncbi:MAG: peptide-methionine (S)-S-oxide reductase MsrA [Candidatus Thiodiazotropha sp. (ex Monitilora ramsayi)]|nr:peptide-methionine (S)-S-oxide reductase MsrA [Candidatus Thiodiazotropha sp. (ex Monitilora ramsayi)]
MKKLKLRHWGLLLAGMFIIISAQAEIKTDEMSSDDSLAVATFAGGCFWCTESDFEKLDGVAKVISGYAGGTHMNPTYQEVSSGATKHLESVEVYYDPDKISYDKLLDAFWKMVNPTDMGGQFVDRGYQYSTAIFYHNEAQRRTAEASLKRLSASGRYDQAIVTPIREAGTFYDAEDYHQDYYKRNPVRYKFYRWNSGRDQYLAKVWGKETLHN